MEGLLLKFGAKPAKRDARNFRMAELLTVAKKPPRTWSFDKKYPGRQYRMYGNDQNGDCVIAARAKQTDCFERIEQGAFINISDAEVIRQWKKENGNTDDGLYILESLGIWRREGWTAAGQLYKIKAFAEVDRTNLTEVKRTAAAQIGLQGGFAMPDNWPEGFRKKKWTDTSQPPNEYNGHCMLITAYDSKGVHLDTWEQDVFASWAWMGEYCTELYGTIDATNEHNIDAAALADMLRKVSPAA